MLLVMALSALLAASSNVLLRYAMDSLEAEGALSVLISALSNPLVLVGLVGYGLSQLLWLNVLTEARLGAAFPVFLSATFIIVMVASVLVLDEHMTVFRAGGALLVTLGIVISEWSRNVAKGERA